MTEGLTQNATSINDNFNTLSQLFYPIVPASTTDVGNEDVSQEETNSTTMEEGEDGKMPAKLTTHDEDQKKK